MMIMNVFFMAIQIISLCKNNDFGSIGNFFKKKNATKRKLLYFCSGDMAEWSIAAVLKTVKPKGFGGSNPSVSAKRR